MSIVPASAQYSFLHVYGSEDDETPKGMLQVKDGGFVFYGSKDNRNYIVKLNGWGEILWELFYNEQSQGDCIFDVIELNDGTLIAGGDAGWQIQSGNPRITRIKPDGTILFDSIYRLSARTSGSIMKIVHNKQKEQFVSIGAGSFSEDQYSLHFQRTDYQGRRLLHRQIPIQMGFRLKHFYKHAHKEEYIVFGEQVLMRLDSAGNKIGDEEAIVDDPKDEVILDVTQIDSGFALLINKRFKGGRIRFVDFSGLPSVKKNIMLPAGTNYGFGSINTTKDKGFIVAGTHLLLLDSNGESLWIKHLLAGDTAGVLSVGQASDGGFYGCGESAGSFETRNVDILAFKTTPEGDIRTGLNERGSKELNVSLWPNPSSGIFHLKGEFKNAQVAVVDLLGNKLLEPVLNGGMLDASALSTGVYFVTVTDQDSTYVRKINIIK